jgi:hypothetical protein
VNDAVGNVSIHKMTSTPVVVVDNENEEVSPYMRLVLEKRARNEQYMKEIGLLEFRDKLKATKKKKATKHSAPKAVVVTPGQERRSPRHKKSSTSPTLLMLSYYQDTDDDDTQAVVSQTKYRAVSATTSSTSSENNHNIAYTTALSTTRRRRVRVDVELSDKDRQVLRGVDDTIQDETYLLQTFQEFLDLHDKISDQNARNVMRQVRKLVKGEGIRYESPKYGWPADCFFLRGTKVTLASDFVDLLQQAVEAEDRWGHDRGNGWLLSHPLKKLLNFQQFVLAHPHVFAQKKNGAAAEQSNKQEVEI